MGTPKHYLEPYQVYILRKLLLERSMNNGFDRLYSYNDLQYENTDKVEILRYLSALSKSKLLSIKEPHFSASDLYAGSGFMTIVSAKKLEKAQAILDRINTRVNGVLTMGELELFTYHMAQDESPPESELFYVWGQNKNDGSDEEIQVCAELHFKVEFDEKGTEALRKYLDDYMAAFVNGELISKEGENYFSCQTSAAILKRGFGRLEKLMGINNLNIKKELFYRDTADYLKNVLNETTSSSENVNFDQIRYLETLIAIEKEGGLEITDMCLDRIVVNLEGIQNSEINRQICGVAEARDQSGKERVQARKEAIKEAIAELRTDKAKSEDVRIKPPKLSGRFKARGKLFEFKYGVN